MGIMSPYFARVSWSFVEFRGQEAVKEFDLADHKSIGSCSGPEFLHRMMAWVGARIDDRDVIQGFSLPVLGLKWFKGARLCPLKPQLLLQRLLLPH
jgi:hypothetical protein